MKKNTKILIAIVTILAIIGVCTSLYYNYENNDVNLEENNLKTISYKDDNGNEVEFQAVDHIVESMEYGSGNFDYALLSEIPEEGIFLYEHKDDGLILVLGDEAEYISKATNIIPPRFYLPQMFYLDFDGDNEKEILIDFYVGSGTGVSYEELAMIEKSTSNDRVFEEMILFDNATYSQILKDNMEYSISDNGNITLNFKPTEGAKDATTYDLGVVEGAEKLDCQSNVRFKVEDNKIIGMHVIGVFQHDYASPTFGVGTIITNVSYDGSEFTLSKFDYIPDEETENQNNENTTKEPTKENNSKTITYTDDKGNKVSFQASEHVVTVDEYGKSEYSLISELPEENIYLYEHHEKGLILVLGDEAEYIYLGNNIITPRFILPKMFYADFDGDSEKEIAIDFYVGSGTGISFEALGVIEKSKTDDKMFEEMKLFHNDMYTNIISENIEYSIDEKSNVSLSFKAKQGEKDAVVYDLGVVEAARELDYSSIQYFEVVDNKIYTYHPLGVLQYDFKSATFGLVGTIKAQVVYKNNEFTLDNFNYIVSEETGK